MVVFCNAEEGKMERGHTSIAFPHVSTDAAFCGKKIQKKVFKQTSKDLEVVALPPTDTDFTKKRKKIAIFL